MFRPVIYRTSPGSSGENIVEMISQRLSKLSHNLFFKSEGNVVTVFSKNEAIPIKDYFTNTKRKQEIKELVRML